MCSTVCLSVFNLRVQTKHIAVNSKIVLESPDDVTPIHFPLSLQEVFPVQYGTKFDTALQGLTAGLVCKMEQLLPVPNLSQVCVSETQIIFIPDE